MSRSYKHTPILKDLHRDIRWRKRAASKAVRRYLGLTNGKMYRKVYPHTFVIIPSIMF